MKYKTGFCLTLSAFLLSSCAPSLTFIPFSAYLEDKDTYIQESGDNYVVPASFVSSYQDVLKSQQNGSQKKVVLPSSGKQKLLVLPVLFPDYPLAKFDASGGKDSLIHLSNSFFGNQKTTKWHSVSSFYNYSSYGKLQLTGEVAPWYILPETFSLANLRRNIRNNNDKVSVTSDIANYALENYIANGNDVSEYDQNDDGIIDSVYIIYGHPYENNEPNNIFWAFAANSNRTKTGLSKRINAYAWSSYDYMELGRGNKSDAHTYIHEMGHLFGLEDYYNTNSQENYGPLGGFDIMDYTLGDHSGLSKMLLDWTRPKYVTGEGKIELKSHTETGELIILKNDWNEKATDEYLLLEYYTPTNLNELDSRLNATFKLPRKNGLKVYHVDARTVVELKDGGSTNYVYTNEYNGEKEGISELLAHSNSSGSANNAPIKDHILYSLLEAKERTTIKEGGFASVHSLFQTGDDFGVNYFKDFTFNDGSKLPYNFVISQMNNEKVVITFNAN